MIWMIKVQAGLFGAKALSVLVKLGTTQLPLQRISIHPQSHLVQIKKGEDNIMRGIALRFGTDDIDVGTLGSALDMSSFGLTFYSSKPKGEQRFTDHLLGMSFINSNLINNSGSASTDGERYGEQLYGYFKFKRLHFQKIDNLH